MNMDASRHDFTGKKIIHNFLPSDYNGGTQNWSICTDKNGIIYIGNQQGILIYDGARWKIVPTRNRTTVRSVTIDSAGVIYYGAIGEFGYLKYDKAGNPHAEVLSELIQFESDDVWSVHSFGDNKICFQTDKTLFVKYKDQIERIPATQGYFYLAFSLNNSLYVHEMGVGGRLLTDTSFHVIRGTETFKDQRVDFVISDEKNRLTFATRAGEIFRASLDNSSMPVIKAMRKLGISSMAKPEEWKIYCGRQIGENTLAIGTTQKGLFLMDTLGKIMFNGNMNNQFVADAIYDILLTDDGVLWLAQDLGVSKVEIGSDVDFWDFSMGIKGSISSMYVFNNRFYCTTGYGLFVLDKPNVFGQPQRFSQVEGIKSQAWGMKSIKNGNTEMLLVVSGEGLFEIKNKAIKVDDVVNSYSIEVVENPEPLVIVAHESGISFFSVKDGKITRLAKNIDLKGQVRRIVADNSGNVWFNIRYKGIYRFSLSQITASGNEPVETQKFVSDSIQNYRITDIFNINGSIYITVNGQLFDPLVNTGVLKPSNAINQLLKTEDLPIIHLDYDFQRERVWVNGYYAVQSDTMESHPVDSLAISMYDFNFINGTYIHKDFIWLATEKGLYKIKTSAVEPEYSLSKPLINQVLTQNDTIGVLNQTVTPEFVWPTDKISFIFSSTNHRGSNKIRFKYKLHGFDKSYEDLEQIYEKTYTNLLPGNYIFELIAIDAHNRESQPQKLEFSISAPWYLSVYAILFYIFVWFYLVVLYVRRRTKKLRRIKIRLEKQVKIRTAQIEAQNAELSKLSIIAEKTDNAVSIFNPDGYLLWCNDAFFKIYGYTGEEFVAVKGTKIFKTHEFQNVRESYQKCLKTKQSVRFEFFTTNRYDEGVWIQTTLTPIVDTHGNIVQLIAVDTDVTHIKNADEEIRFQKEQLEIKNHELKELSAIAEETDNAVIIADRDGKIMWINKGFTKIYGYSLDELLLHGDNLTDLSSNPDLVKWIHEWPIDQVSKFYESQNRTKDKQLVWAHTTITSIRDDNGEIIRLIAIDSDISKLKEAEGEIARQKSQLEQLNATKDKFFSIIGHDLRSPFGNFVGITNLILQNIKEYDKEQLLQYIIKLNRSAQNSYNLLENLLAWAKSQRGTLSYNPLENNLTSIIEENIELLKPFAERKNITIDQNFKSDILALFDEDMVNTVVRNLLFNALKYSNPGGHIVVSIEKCNEKICVKVSDNGVGIAPEDMSKLFDLNAVYTTLGTENERGTGLGLVLCSDFIRHHGGEIGVESQSGKGSTFWFNLPLNPEIRF
jgi:PAS domain S-box-containing protein